MEFDSKKVLVIGAGISGFAAAKIAKKFGAEVTLSDAKAEDDLKYDFSELRSLALLGFLLVAKVGFLLSDFSLS